MSTSRPSTLARATSSRTLHVAGAQVAVSDQLEANVRTLHRALDWASEVGADILATPEGSLSGYRSDFDPRAVSDATRDFVALAASRNVSLALGTCFAEKDGKPYNEVRFYDRTGELRGFHAKILLCKRVRDTEANPELDRFATRPLSIVHVDGMVAGGLVCNDLWADPEVTTMDDPHLTQQLSDLGARVIFHSVNSGQSRGDELHLQRAFHDSNLRMRARTAGVWIVTVDAADGSGRAGSRAPSGILDPRGVWVVKAPARGEHFFSAKISVDDAVEGVSAIY